MPTKLKAISRDIHMRVALIHDHLNQIGGAEKVLKALTEMFPQAPIYTLVQSPDLIADFLATSKIIPSFLQKLPGALNHLRWYLALMPVAVETFNLQPYDLVISDASAFAKGVLVRSNAWHVCYCHTPTRYLWSDANQYTEDLHQPGFIKKLLPIILTQLRVWDYNAAQRVDYFIANSQFVAQRIKKYYNRPATVIYPPVDTHHYQPSGERDNYYLLVSRLRAYKRVDVAVEAFNELKIPLVIVGSGPEERRLKKKAKSHIRFMGQLSDEEKRRFLSRCLALIHPQEEDFGITAVEAMATGKPVIAYKGGGCLETVIDGETGVFFEDPGWEALAHTVIRFNSQAFDPIKISQHAQKFNIKRFKQEMEDFIESKILEVKG